MAEQKQYIKPGLVTVAGLLALTAIVFNVNRWREQKHESPHYRAEACLVCHVVKDEPALKTTEVELCTSCHEREGEVIVKNAEGTEITVDIGKSHPYGIFPTAKSTPLTLPLNNGMLTCQTCHDVHLSNTDSHMLRHYKMQVNGKPDWGPLCRDCHLGYF